MDLEPSIITTSVLIETMKRVETSFPLVFSQQARN